MVCLVTLMQFTCIMALTSSSVLISIWRVSRNFFNVDIVMTLLLQDRKSLLAAMWAMLEAAIASKYFFCVCFASVRSISSEQLRVSRPARQNTTVWPLWLNTAEAPAAAYDPALTNLPLDNYLRQLRGTSTFLSVQCGSRYRRYRELIKNITQVLPGN